MGKKKVAKVDEIKQYSTNFGKQLQYKVDLKCKNQKQKDFLRLLKDKKKEICFGIGSAGTGKSYISIAYALQALKEDNSFKKIIIIPPTVEAGSGGLNIGYLKGDLDTKVAPYIEADTYTIQKIFEKSGNDKAKEKTKQLFENGYIEYQLVNFARGKNWDDCIVLLNESENYSKEEMLLLLTRMGENVKLIVTGDPLQKDRRDIKKFEDGMSFYVKSLSDLDEVGSVTFVNEDIVRNPLIQKIIDRS